MNIPINVVQKTRNLVQRKYFEDKIEKSSELSSWLARDKTCRRLHPTLHVWDGNIVSNLL